VVRSNRTRNRSRPEQIGEALQRYQLEEEHIREDDWRGRRRRASLFVALFIPILAGLLVASFPFLTRIQLTGTAAVLADAALGGLLGAVLCCVSRLTAIARARRPIEEVGGLVWIIVPPLALGLFASLGAALALLRVVARDAYKPQTVYLLAVALTVTLCKATRTQLVEVVDSVRLDRADR
jgi:hypothetical protein